MAASNVSKRASHRLDIFIELSTSCPRTAPGAIPSRTAGARHTTEKPSLSSTNATIATESLALLFAPAHRLFQGPTQESVRHRHLWGRCRISTGSTAFAPPKFVQPPYVSRGTNLPAPIARKWRFQTLQPCTRACDLAALRAVAGAARRAASVA